MQRFMSRRSLAGIATAALIALAPAGARAQDFINVLTGGTSGVYYPLGVALSKIYGDKIKNIRPTVQATKASVENLQLLQQAKGEIAFTLGDSLAAAWKPASSRRSRSCAASPRSIRTTSRSSRPRTAASRPWPISRASASRSARRNRAPS
jgi:TRAP transporter TAXI family solute receptor